MTNKLFVGGLAYGVTDSQLESHFLQFGKVLSAKVIVDRYSGQSKGFGFVEMSTEEEAKTAINKLNGTQLSERTIIVKEAFPPRDRDNNFQQGNNRRQNRW